LARGSRSSTPSSTGAVLSG